MTIEYRADRGRIEDYTDSNGFLRVPGSAARTGILVYKNADGTERRELVLPEELFSEESLKSLSGAPVTHLHPQESITPENYSLYAQGSIHGQPRRDGDQLVVELSINGKDAIDAVRGGKHELSLGYAVELDETPGEWQGQRYDAVQRNRVYNHIAIVPRGRAGRECRINFDAFYEDEEVQTMPQVKLPNGVTVDVQDAGTATAIQAELNAAVSRADSAEEQLTAAADILQVLNLDADMSKEDMQKKMDMIKSKMEGMSKEDAEKLQAQYDEMKSQMDKRSDADDVSAAVADTLKVVEQCRRVDSAFDPMTEKGVMTAREMQVATIKKQNADFDDTGKSDEYVSARFDAMLDFIGKGKVAKQREAAFNADGAQAKKSVQQQHNEKFLKGEA